MRDAGPTAKALGCAPLDLCRFVQARGSRRCTALQPLLHNVAPRRSSTARRNRLQSRRAQRHDELLVVPSHLFLMLPKYLAASVIAQLPPGYADEFDALETWCRADQAADQCGTGARVYAHKRAYTHACAHTHMRTSTCTCTHRPG